MGLYRDPNKQIVKFPAWPQPELHAVLGYVGMLDGTMSGWLVYIVYINRGYSWRVYVLRTVGV